MRRVPGPLAGLLTTTSRSSSVIAVRASSALIFLYGMTSVLRYRSSAPLYVVNPVVSPPNIRRASERLRGNRPRPLPQ